MFGGATGDKVADEILAALQGAGADGLDRTQISNLFNRNRTASQIKNALQSLLESGRVEKVPEKTDGRPREIFRLLAYEINEINEISRDADEGDDLNSFNSYHTAESNSNDREVFEV